MREGGRYALDQLTSLITALTEAALTLDLGTCWSPSSIFLRHVYRLTTHWTDIPYIDWTP